MKPEKVKKTKRRHDDADYKAELDAFDFVVTIALGSTLATVLLNKGVALADGLLAFALLIFLQYAITWLSVRSMAVRKFVKNEPRLLVFRGRYLRAARRSERVTEEEIRAVLCQNDVSRLEEADAVVLETDGNLTVIQKVDHVTDSALAGVNKPTELAQPG